MKLAMKKFLPFFLGWLSFFLPFFKPFPAWAHPMDIAYLDLYVSKDSSGQPISESNFQAHLYLSWPEAALLAKRGQKNLGLNSDLLESALGSVSGNLSPESVGFDPAKPITQLLDFGQSYLEYLNKYLLIFNQDKICQLSLNNLPEQPESGILFGRGIHLVLDGRCSQPLGELRIISNLFADEFEAQINIVNIFEGPEKTLKGALLTARSRDLTINLKEKYSSFVPQKGIDLSSTSKYFGQILSLFTEKGKNSLSWAMGLVFLLGLLHTLEAGHSKTILVSYLLNKEVGLRQALIYVTVFTLTHLSDILLVGTIFLVANAFVDIYSKLSYLQTFSLYALLFISIYLFFTNLAHFLKHRLGLYHQHGEKGHSHESISVKKAKKQDFKDQLILGFIVGLSPCLMGWSIFMVVLSTKKIWSLFPIIFSFGLGIFAALSLVAVLVTKFKIKLFEKYQWLGEVSPMISSLLLAGFALILLI